MSIATRQQHNNQRNARRHRAVQAAFWLLFICVSSFSAQTETDEANKLVDKANEHTQAARAIQNKNEAKVTDYKAALNKSQFKKAALILDGVISDIDQGVQHGEMAVEALDQGSRLDVQPAFGAYLALRASSVQMRVISYKILREMFQVTSQMLLNPTPRSVRLAQPKIQDFQKRISTFDKMADDLEERSEAIRKKYPAEFKQGLVAAQR